MKSVSTKKLKWLFDYFLAQSFKTVFLWSRKNEENKNMISFIFICKDVSGNNDIERIAFYATNQKLNDVMKNVYKSIMWFSLLWMRVWGESSREKKNFDFRRDKNKFFYKTWLTSLD